MAKLILRLAHAASGGGPASSALIQALQVYKAIPDDLMSEEIWFKWDEEGSLLVRSKLAHYLESYKLLADHRAKPLHVQQGTSNSNIGFFKQKNTVRESVRRMDAGEMRFFLPKGTGSRETGARNFCHNSECFVNSSGSIAIVANLKRGSGELNGQVMMCSRFESMTALHKASTSEKEKAAKIAATRFSLLHSTGGSTNLMQVVVEIDEEGYLVEKQGAVVASPIRVGDWTTYKHAAKKPLTRFEFCPGNGVANALAKEGGEEKEEEEKEEWVLVGTKEDREKNKSEQEKKSKKAKKKRAEKKKKGGE